MPHIEKDLKKKAFLLMLSIMANKVLIWHWQISTNMIFFLLDWMLPGMSGIEICSGVGDRFFYIDTDGFAHVCPYCSGKIANVKNNTG